MGVQNSIDRLNSIKERIRTNLAAQGITVPADAVLATMAEQILSVAGEDGRGIVSIARTKGNGAAGTTDIYTITYTDDTTSSFNVYNGANGSDYVLTDEDIAAIAQQAANKIDVSGKLDKSGGTMTGKLVAQSNTNYADRQMRNIVSVEKGEVIPTTQPGDYVFVREV